MNLFLEKDYEIRLSLINLFKHRPNEVVTRSELSETLNLRKKKISTLIKNINEDFEEVYGDETFFIAKIKGKGHILNRSPVILKKIEIYYYEKSISFLFIKKILIDEKKSTVKFCLDNYISLSTLNRKVNRIKPIFKSFNLKLNVNRGLILGEEIRIRQFYYELFKNVYGTYDWPVKTIEKKNINQKIEELINEIGSELNFIDRYTIEIYMAVVLIRIRQSNFVNKSFNEHSWISNHPLYSNFNNFLVTQFKNLDPRISIIETDYLILLFMSSMVIDRSKKMMDKELAFFRENKIDEYIKVRKLQKELSYRYSNESKLTDDYLTYILTRNILYLEKFGYVQDYQKLNNFLNNQESQYPIFFNFVKKLVDKYMGNNLNYIQLDLFISEIIPILQANISVIEYEKPIKIGLFYEIGTVQQYIAQNYIVERINKNIKFDYDEHNLSEMDIIITDEKNYHDIKNKLKLKIPVIIFDKSIKNNVIDLLNEIINKIKK